MSRCVTIVTTVGFYLFDRVRYTLPVTGFVTSACFHAAQTISSSSDEEPAFWARLGLLPLGIVVERYAVRVFVAEDPF